MPVDHALTASMFAFTKILTFEFGSTSYPNGGQYGPLSGQRLSVLYLKSGNVKIEMDGSTREYREGQAGLIYNERPVTFHYPENTFSDVMWCCTDNMEISPGIIKKIKKLPSSSDHVDDLVTLLGMGVETARGNEEISRYKTNILGSAVLAAYIYHAESGKKDDIYPVSVLRVKKFIERCFAEDHNLNSIASAFNINPRYLLKLYKQYFNITPSEHLWDLRLEKGLKLLFTSELPISKIATLSGFKNPNHFSRYVKENFNHPPTQLRNKFHQRETEKY